MPPRCAQPGCGWQTLNPEQPVSEGLAVWHVYEDHPDVWRQIAGDRPPRDPDPRDPAVRARISGNLPAGGRQWKLR
jgi:hypothetical protein